MSKEGIKGQAIGRSDIYRMEPRHLHVKEGWNARVVNFNPEDPDDIALARSIAEVGVKQPLTVYWEDGKAFISDGHRRHAAAMYAIDVIGTALASVPVQTEDRYSNEGDRVFSQIVRNSGKPLTPFEQATVFKRLIDLGWTETEIANRSGLARNWVVDILQLRAAPREITKLVEDGAVSATMALKTLKSNKGDTSKTVTDLTTAVDTAREAGKTRATAKHLGEKKPSLKAELKTIFEAAKVDQSLPLLDDAETYTITVTADQYASLRSLIGF